MSGFKLKYQDPPLSSSSSCSSDEDSDDVDSDELELHLPPPTGKTVTYLSLKKDKGRDEDSSSEEEEEEDENSKLCPFGRTKVNRLLIEVSDEDWISQHRAQRRLVADAYTAWDTRAEIGEFHNELAIPQQTRDSSPPKTPASRSGSRATPKKPPTRPVTGIGSVRPVPTYNRLSFRPDFKFQHHSDPTAHMEQYRQYHTVSHTGRVTCDMSKVSAVTALLHNKHRSARETVTTTRGGAGVGSAGPESATTTAHDLQQLRECTDPVEKLRLLAMARRKIASAPPYRTSFLGIEGVYVQNLLLASTPPPTPSSPNADTQPPGSDATDLSSVRLTARAISNVSEHFMQRKMTPLETIAVTNSANEARHVSEFKNEINARRAAHEAKHIQTSAAKALISAKSNSSLGGKSTISVDTPPTTKVLTNPLGDTSRKLNVNLTPVRDNIQQQVELDTQKKYRSGYQLHMDLSTPRSTFQSGTTPSRPGFEFTRPPSRTQSLYTSPRTSERPQTRPGNMSARSRTQTQNGVVLGKKWQNGLMIQPTNFAPVAQLLSYVQNTSRSSPIMSHSPVICSSATRGSKS